MSIWEPPLITAPVSALSLYVGAPCGSLGEPMLQLKPKHTRCVLCNIRLDRVKYTHPHGSGNACHPRCKSTDIAHPVAHTPVRSHKPLPPVSGQPRSAISIAPPPAPTHQQLSMATHGWAIHSSTRSSRSTAASWLEMATGDELNRWELKRGGFYQHDTALSLTCSLLDEKRVRLRHSAESIAREALADHAVDVTKLNLGDVKLLRSSHGEGKQEIHFDIPNYQLAVRCYSVLIYLTDTMHTAVPDRHLCELRDCFTEGEKMPSPAALQLLSSERFISQRVEAGTILAFNCTVPHYGVANPDEHDRYVLFLSFYPNDASKPDTELQRYPKGVKD